MKTITGKTIDGNYLGAAKRSCAKVDYPTSERITVTIDGTEYERTVHERAIWRNGPRGNTVIAQFVIVNGTNWEVKDED